MRKIICGLAIIATIALVCIAFKYRNRDMGNMSQPPLPEYTVVKTNPAVIAQQEQPAQVNTNNDMMGVKITGITLQ